MGKILKGKGKASSTSYLAISYGSQSQAAKEQHRLGEILDAQQREINPLKKVIAQLTVGQSPPSSLPSPEDAEDLGKD